MNNFINKKHYYIGFNPINGICNEAFFAGSITAFPTFEKGNIFFSNHYMDTHSESFFREYRNFVYSTAKELQRTNENVDFICFNDKKRIKNMCSDMDDLNILPGNSSEILETLNDKFTLRHMVSNANIPTLDYLYYASNDLDYEHICTILNHHQFVVQGKTGAGGNDTYFINSKNVLSESPLFDDIYSVSKYIHHTPLNITCIVFAKDTLLLPISVQLISVINNHFLYMGGDFIAAQHLSSNVNSKINRFSLRICEIARQLGYRGILGIDFLLTNKDEVIFMEVNPRYQASSFLVSNALLSLDKTVMAELHYNALENMSIPKIHLKNINRSFLNCYSTPRWFETDTIFANFEIIKNGYFSQDKDSVFRKVYNHSIFPHRVFQKNSNYNNFAEM